MKQAEADQIVKAMNEKKIPVTYVLFPDEGHGFARPENRFAFYAITEGVPRQAPRRPLRTATAEDLEGSSLHVPAGADDVPGLAEVLPADAQRDAEGGREEGSRRSVTGQRRLQV